jgi:glycerol-3-phosphate dehydrogenase
MAMGPEVARLMAEELNKDTEWQTEQVKAFNKVAGNYILAGERIKS